jgi:hypothetical protein
MSLTPLPSNQIQLKLTLRMLVLSSAALIVNADKNVAKIASARTREAVLSQVGRRTSLNT